MITPGVAASMTPTELQPRRRAAHRAPAHRRLRVPAVLLHLPRPHLPHRHA